MEDWYPDLLTRTHFVPPLAFHRTAARPEELASGERVWVTQPPPDLEAKDDAALSVVRQVLGRAAARHGPVLVQTGLDFGHYLGENAYAAVAGTLCRPAQLKEKGDFDVLIFNRSVSDR